MYNKTKILMRKEERKMMRKWFIILLLFPLILLSSCFSNPPDVTIQYESPLGTFTYEFTHTIEGGYYQAPGTIDLHFFIGYYNNKMEYLDIIKLCLLDGEVVDGKRCVIPENHWKSYYK